MRLHIAAAFLSGALAQNNQTSFNETSTGGGLIGGGLGGGMMGSDFCTYSPNTTCFPSTNGFPPCCVEDPKPEGCGTGEYPECEKTAVGEPLAPPPSPASDEATAEPTSSSNALVFSLAAIVGAHAVACMTGMW